MILKDKTILLTGASTGIGRELAKELAGMGNNLILLARRIELVNKYVEEIDKQGITILPIKCDVGKKEEVNETILKIKSKIKNDIDIAILNAAVDRKVTLETFTGKDAEETFNTNVMGIIYFVEKLLPDFMKRNQGMIVGVSSLADSRGFSGSGFYCASKAAASIYLEGLRVDTYKHGIKVITVKPGFVKTPMTDNNKYKMPFLMSPERASKIIIKGIEREKSIVQFPIPTVLLTKLVNSLPSYIYEWIAVRQKIK